jgi:hypothetical protein
MAIVISLVLCLGLFAAMLGVLFPETVLPFFATLLESNLIPWK